MPWEVAAKALDVSASELDLGDRVHETETPHIGWVHLKANGTRALRVHDLANQAEKHGWDHFKPLLGLADHAAHDEAPRVAPSPRHPPSLQVKESIVAVAAEHLGVEADVLEATLPQTSHDWG